MYRVWFIVFGQSWSAHELTTWLSVKDNWAFVVVLGAVLHSPTKCALCLVSVPASPHIAQAETAPSPSIGFASDPSYWIDLGPHSDLLQRAHVMSKTMLRIRLSFGESADVASPKSARSAETRTA